MKKEQILRLAVCAAVTLLVSTESVWAQAKPAARSAAAPAAGGSAEGQVKISRLPPPGRTAMVKAPQFNYSVNNTQSSVNKKPREWALFEVKYETSAKWMDELTFEYHVMTKGKHDETKADIYSYYTASVRYIDIPKGDHMSCVALPPSLVERYGEPIAVALEITGKEGTVLASEALASGIQLPRDWWRDATVMDKRDAAGNPFLTRRNGLMERSKTPFALVNPDDYEVVQ